MQWPHSTSICLLAAALLCSVSGAQAQTATPDSASGAVTLQQTENTFTLQNAFVSATISKVSGDLVSLRYRGVETMGYVSGKHAGYWEQTPAGAARLQSSVTLDPASTKGERAEISVKGFSDGEPLGAHPRRDPADSLEDPASQLAGRTVGPPPGSGRSANAGTAISRRSGAAAGGRSSGPLLDLEIRYALGREDHGLYTYAIFTHQPSYGATELGESRFGLKLNGQVFDWLSVDAQRNGPMPTGKDWDLGEETNIKEARRLKTGIRKGIVEHKYDYCADQFDTPVYGWASTKQQLGFYLINPSTEYISSGPFHGELTGHIDDGDGGDPTLLDYWRGTHFGGSELRVAAGESWTKVVGPILIYLNSGQSPNALFLDAKSQAVREAARWPYSWVHGVDYPSRAERATVTGQLQLDDPAAPGAALPNLLVGLAYPDESATPPMLSQAPPSAASPEDAASPARDRFSPQPVTWQTDAKHYEFWVRGTPDGRFSLPNVRPGTYELHAVADGVLGEYSRARVTVQPGGRLDLGTLRWTPVRYGRQLWQIGVPNRNASEFLDGNDHWHWGLYLQYANLFPKDITFTVGKSDWHRDWFLYQVPHAVNDDGNARSRGRATTWQIRFQLPSDLAAGPALPGEAILRLALAGVGTPRVAVEVNGKPAGELTGLRYNATINRDGIQGSWVEKDLPFPASLLRHGENTLSLTVPAGGLTAGLAYDVLRLEYAPTTQAPPSH